MNRKLKKKKAKFTWPRPDWLSGGQQALREAGLAEVYNWAYMQTHTCGATRMDDLLRTKPQHDTYDPDFAVEHDAEHQRRLAVLDLWEDLHGI